MIQEPWTRPSSLCLLTIFTLSMSLLLCGRRRWARPWRKFMSQKNSCSRTSKVLWHMRIRFPIGKICLQLVNFIFVFFTILAAAPIPFNVGLAINHSIFIKGDQTNFEIDPSWGVEASELYPDVKYSTVDEMLDQLVWGLYSEITIQMVATCKWMFLQNSVYAFSPSVLNCSDLYLQQQWSVWI